MSAFYIPEPCHEKWEKMTPKEQGRHCDVCSKVVIDFTQKTNLEVESILTGAEGHVCGHFRVSQLNQTEQQKVFRKSGNIFNRNWKYFALTVLGFFLLGKKTEAQKMGKVKISGGPRPIHDEPINTQLKLSGTIYTPDHKPAGGANIIFSSGGKEIGRTRSIANGTYRFIFSQEKGLQGNRVDIQVTYQYYEPKMIQGLALPNAQNVLNITLEEMALIMGQVIAPYVPDSTTEKKLVKEEEPKKVLEEGKLPVDTDSVKLEEPVKKETVKEPAQKELEIIPANVVRPEEIVATIYPNPAQNTATIYCHLFSNYTIELFDAKGTLQTSKIFSGDRTDLEISGLSRGAYFVKIRDEKNQTHTLKLVKQ